MLARAMAFSAKVTVVALTAAAHFGRGGGAGGESETAAAAAGRGAPGMAATLACFPSTHRPVQV